MPITMYKPKSAASKELFKLASCVLGESHREEHFLVRFFRRMGAK